MGLVCAPTFRNVPNVDLLVSDETGSETLSLQVKTAWWALRRRGRGEQRKPHHYEWSMNWKSARLNTGNLFFAFVDLKKFTELPDIFTVPSSIVAAYYEGGDPATWIWPRYHEDVETLQPYKNERGLKLILDHLKIAPAPPTNTLGMAQTSPITDQRPETKVSATSSHPLQSQAARPFLQIAVKTKASRRTSIAPRTNQAAGCAYKRSLSRSRVARQNAFISV
jgi:hypothetical protein